MNRSQRRYGRLTNKKNETKENGIDPGMKTNNDNIEEVLAPKDRRNTFMSDKATANRCCHVTPIQKDKSLLTDNQPSDNQYENLILAHYNLDPVIPDTIKQLDELRKLLCRDTRKAEKSSQYISPIEEPIPSFIEIADGSQWQNVDNADDLDNILSAEKGEIVKSQKSHLKNIHISDIPRVKTIAEKYSKFKKNIVELRKLEEKVVCVEYDVFQEDDISGPPAQTMRAYFSLIPMDGASNDGELLVLPSTVKQKYNLKDEDLGKLNEKEIEIIDAKMSENRPYLDDLKKVLKRKRAISAKKNKSSLDLMSLYEMAKRDCPSLDEDFSDTNLLSKAELQEIKNLITGKCASSIHGISRRTVKSEKETLDSKRDGKTSVISESIFAELVRNEYY